MPQPPESDEVARGVAKLNCLKPRVGKESNIPVVVTKGTETVMVGRITIPKGKKFVPHGTFNSMCGQLGLTKQQMRDLCQCPMKRAGFEKLWREAWDQKKAYPSELDVERVFWL